MISETYVNPLASSLPVAKTCTKCGELKPIAMFGPDKTRKDGYRNYCKACALLYVADWQRRHPERVRQYGKRLRSARILTAEGRGTQLWHQAKKRAKDRGQEFSIDRDWVIAEVRKGLCTMTGVRLDLSPCDKYHYNPRAPSLDRKDSKLGYTPDNTRLVCTAMNIALHQFGEEFFELIARGYLRRLG